MNDGDQVIAYLKGNAPYADREKFPLPSVLLLDLKMPRMNGFQVMEWLHAQKEFKNLLTIVLTGHEELKEVQQAYKLGAHSFLVKPCKSEDIKNLIHWYSEHWDSRT
jgi:CheY-like chemotaxis protein